MCRTNHSTFVKCKEQLRPFHGGCRRVIGEVRWSPSARNVTLKGVDLEPDNEVRLANSKEARVAVKLVCRKGAADVSKYKNV